jgi:hypothetical protein
MGVTSLALIAPYIYCSPAAAAVALLLCLLRACKSFVFDLIFDFSYSLSDIVLATVRNNESLGCSQGFFLIILKEKK